MSTILKRIKEINAKKARQLHLFTLLKNIEQHDMNNYKWKHALTQLDKAAQTHGISPQLLIMKARAYYQLAKYQKSVMLFRQALKLSPHGPPQQANTLLDE